MATVTINSNQTTTFDTREGGDDLSLTNNNEEGNATYTISIDDADSTAHTLEPGETDNYTMTNRETASVHNTGTLDIEADFE